ncbi:hypothetical protein [Acidithiobacillus sp.]|uniref:hypothetical protein n=1 Tax=Acidithiobacillus sp. TaxID=1872118 RepID=UPI0025B9E754|nr:hypothetical protein [Acidithiobacillus sp.]
MARARGNPRIFEGRGLLPILALGLLLALLLFWLAQGPRYLVAQALSAGVGQRVRLAANPGFFLDQGDLGIVLRGLVIGPSPDPLLRVPRLQTELSLAELLRGHLRLRRVSADAPRIRGPWPGSGAGASLPPLPRELLLRGATLQWTQAGRTLHLRHLDLRWQQGRLDARGRWSMPGAAGDLTLQGRLPTSAGPQMGELQLAIRSSRGNDRLHLRLQGLQRDGANLALARLEGEGHWRRRDFFLNMDGLTWQAQSARFSCVRAQVQTSGAALGLRDFRFDLRPSQSFETRLQMHIAKPQAIAQEFGIHTPHFAAAARTALDPLQLEGELSGRWPADWSMSAVEGRLGTTHFRGRLQLRLHPLRLDLALSIPSLDLDPYLPRSSPRTTPSPLPVLPTQWPVQGRVTIGRLHWQGYTARGVVMEIRP